MNSLTPQRSSRYSIDLIKRFCVLQRNNNFVWRNNSWSMLRTYREERQSESLAKDDDERREDAAAQGGKMGMTQTHSGNDHQRGKTEDKRKNTMTNARQRDHQALSTDWRTSTCFWIWKLLRLVYFVRLLQKLSLKVNFNVLVIWNWDLIVNSIRHEILHFIKKMNARSQFDS